MFAIFSFLTFGDSSAVARPSTPHRLTDSGWGGRGPGRGADLVWSAPIHPLIRPSVPACATTDSDYTC